MSSHSCLAKEFHWGCVEFILKANTPKLLFLRSTGEFYPIDWWSHDKSMCEVFTIWGVCVDNVVRVYGWSLGKGQNILAKRLKIDFLGALCKILVQNFVYTWPFSKIIFHLINPKEGQVKRKSLGNQIRHALSAQNCHALWHTELPSLPASQLFANLWRNPSSGLLFRCA